MSHHEDWLTVKEFAAMVGMHEKSVREAIRKNRLNRKYRVERVTEGKRAAIRIVVPRAA
jgi:predicted transcriptional regulator of viral defense system